jgi:TNF receptor-associated factor 4
MYACLLKGEEDDSLEWPFCGDITVEVLNWHGDHGHYKKVITLDSPDDDTCSRVMTDVTSPSGSGEPQFIPLSALTSQYLEDDCMRVRISSVVSYNTPLRYKIPRWQEQWNTSFCLSRSLAFTVTGFSHRLENGSTCYSPAFYTHSKGYKMRLEVTPGASGEDKGNMSIFAQLMAGEYDSSLQWPVNVDLTVEVVNWAANSSHITEIIPFGGRDMDYFSRVPEGSKVVRRGWGCGRFCSHATLRGATRNIAYVEEDCVHVRVREAEVHSS